MANQNRNTFLQRRKEDGSHDLICLTCLATISSPSVEDRRDEVAGEHICVHPFPAMRSRLGTKASLRVCSEGAARQAYPPEDSGTKDQEITETRISQIYRLQA